MLKQFKGKILGKDVSIRKLSAHSALRVHARALKFISGSIGELAEGMGKADDVQSSHLSKAISDAFIAEGSEDELVSFIESALTSGNVIIDKSPVTHLDDFERFDDIDGSEFMYSVFGEWVKLNLGSLLKKINGHVAG